MVVNFATQVPNQFFETLENTFEKLFKWKLFFLSSSTIAHIFTALIIPWKTSMYNRSADRCWAIVASLTAQLYLFFITLDSNWCQFNYAAYQPEPFNSNISPGKLAFFPLSWLLISATLHISFLIKLSLCLLRGRLASFRSIRLKRKQAYTLIQAPPTITFGESLDHYERRFLHPNSCLAGSSQELIQNGEVLDIVL